mmetsp:Transcript_31337/g.43470  ORF Transcript_31337/g.43470 Transcript_31337/m.43470 type:complete len:84 (-) Transcript_31337:139-390(-)
MSAAPRLSGLQRQVLRLHRQIIRTAREKDVDTRASIMKYARSEFDKNKNIDRKNVLLIEHLLRKASKHLELSQSETFSGINIK